MALHSPLSENMSEFFLLAFLALFSGLFPRAEPSRGSDEERGKENRAAGNAQSDQTWRRGPCVVAPGPVAATVRAPNVVR